MKTFADYNIQADSGNGQQRTTCPNCSAGRKKQTEKCLSVNTDDGIWFCNHCGYTGGLGGKKYVIPEYKYPKKNYHKIETWFEKRGISEKTLDKFKIGYDGKNIMFPYFRNNIAVNIKHRDHKKTMFQTKGAQKIFYNLDNIDASKPVIIVEGEIDALSMHESGIKNVISVPDGAPTPNTKNFTTKFGFLNSARELEKVKKFIVAIDDDAPGRLLGEELARRLGKERCWAVKYPKGCKDANDVLVQHGTQSVCQIIDEAKPYPVKGLYNPSDYLSQVEKIYHEGKAHGITTGWETLDTFYNVAPGQLCIVTGIPGSGKSTFMDCLSIKLAVENKWKIAMFSPENWPPERHILTLIEKLTDRPFFSTYMAERMHIDTVRESIEYLDDKIFVIKPDEDEDGITVDSILRMAKIALFRHGINGLVIDPWNEIDHNYQRLSEVQYISKELSKIRRFGRVNGIAIWIVAHPRNLIKDKDGTYKAPTMYEISGGAQWRNKSDVGLCVHRENLQSLNVRILIQKMRFRDLGRPGEAMLKFKPETATYDVTEEYENEFG